MLSLAIPSLRSVKASVAAAFAAAISWSFVCCFAYNIRDFSVALSASASTVASCDFFA
jgi:hypothetical protein